MLKNVSSSVIRWRWWGELAAVGLLLGLVLGVALWWHRGSGRETDGESRHRGVVIRAHAYLHQGRPDLALQAVSHIRDETPEAGEALVVAGLALIALNEVRHARMALERALALRPDQPMAAKVLAAIYLSTGDSVRGIEMLETAARLDPQDFRPWLALGKVHHDLGELNQAIRAYEEALRRDPTNQEARVGLIGDLLESRRVAEATPWLTEALEAAPQDARVLGLAARQARDLGQLESAAAFAEQALAADPQNLDALLVRARLALTDDDPDAAREDLDQAVAAHPNALAALQLLAQVEARLGHAERAAELIERHQQATERALLMDQLTREISQHPDDPELRWRLGVVAGEIGSYELARDCFQAALDVDPTFQPARQSLADLHASHPALAPPARWIPPTPLLPHSAPRPSPLPRP